MRDDFNIIFISRKYINDSCLSIYGGSWRCKMINEKLDRIENKIDSLIKVIVPEVENKRTREDWEELML